MADQAMVLELVRRYFQYAGVDVDRAHELYHDDAVLEFPQSGERFEGVANFREWRRQYPAQVRFQVRRITARGDKVARERIYGGEGWEAPDWRAPWRSDTPADPPE